MPRISPTHDTEELGGLHATAVPVRIDAMPTTTNINNIIINKTAKFSSCFVLRMA